MKQLRLLAAFAVLMLTGRMLNAQIAGTFSVPATYSTIAAAITDLNTQGVNGPVTILVDAGYTETAPVGGYTFTATGTAANPIVFQKNGSGSNPQILAYAGGTATPSSAIQDGVWKFIGSDYITIDGIDIFDQNTTNPSTMEYGYGFFKAGTTDGCQNNSIINCNISLNRVNNALGSGPAADGSRGIDVVNALYISHTTNVVVGSAAGANSNNRFYTNTIQNCNIGIAIMGYAATTPFTNADQNNDIGGNSPSFGNTIINFGGGGTTAPAAGIRTLAQYNLNVANNNINSNNGSGVLHAQVLRGIYIGAATSANTSILNNTISVNGGGTTNQVSPIENNSGTTASGNTVTINNNLITNCTYTTATSGVFYSIYNTASPAVLSISNNTLTNNSTNATSGSYYNIYTTGAPTISNTISNNLISGITFSASSTTLINYNIYNSSAGSTSTVNISNNNLDNIVYSGATGGTGTWYGIYAGGTASLYNVQNNTYTNLNLKNTGTFYMLYFYNYSTVANISNNSIVGSFTRSAAGSGSLYGIYNGYFTTLGTTANVFNNNFSNINNGTNTGAIYMFYWTTHQTLNVYNNTFSNILAPSATSTFYGMYLYYYSATTNVYDNTVSNVTYGSTSGTIYGMYYYEYYATTANVYNNTLYNLQNGGTTNIGMYIYYTGNAGGGSYNFYRNRISDIGSSSISASNISGINLYSFYGGNVNLYNNLIGNITATATSNSNAVMGINISGTSTGLNAGVYYNSIYLNGTSTGSGFGSSGIFANTGSNLTMKNNIIVNNSTPTGAGFAVAYRRSSTNMATYSSTSNNNLFYAGTPGTNNLIFYDGTNSYQTLSAYQAAAAPKDGISVTENPPFVSTAGNNSNFLNISTGTPTQIEGWAIPVAGITTDYTLTVRNASTPDIGAWEGNYISSIPVCSGTPASNTAVSSSSIICANASFNLYLATSYTNSGMSYQWQASPTGLAGTYTNIPGATAAAYTNPGITSPAWYQAIITCTASSASVTSTPVQVLINTNSCQCGNYCPSNATSTADEEIFNVSIGTLNNTSNCSQTGGPGSILNEYSNYTGMLTPPLLAAGSTYVLSVTAGECSGNSYSAIVGVYMDFNQNGLFTDAGELVYTSPYGSIAVAGTTFTSNITIPLTANTGITRMRAVVVESSVVNPCGTYSWGEAEDYCINIGTASGCSGVPAANSVVSTVTASCPNGTVGLGLATSYTTSGLTYQWSTATSSVGPYTAVTNGTLSSLTVTNFTAPTWFQAVITCTNGNVSTTATPVQVIVNNNPCQCANYCTTSMASSTADEEVFYVSIGTLSNTSTCAQTGGPGSILNRYSNYTGMISAPSLTVGNTYSLTLVGGECNGNSYSGMMAAYIDFNQNGVFTDPGENVFTSPYGPIAVAGSTFNANVVVPTSAVPGTSRMRVVIVESSAITPCGGYTWGETEDYCVYIDPGPPCTAANGGTLTTSSFSVCNNNVVALTSNSVSLGSGMSYQWMVSTTSGGPYSPVTGGTGSVSTTYTTLPLSATNVFYYVLQATCSTASLTGISNEATIAVNPIPTAFVPSVSPICAGQSVAFSSTTNIGTNFTWTGPASFTSNVQNPVITNAPANAQGNYTLVVSANNCSATPVTVSLTVNSTNLNIMGSALMCLGNSSTLIAVGNATAWTWNTGATTNSIVVSPTTNTVYSVAGTGTSNCTANASMSITVSNPTITGTGTTVCNAGSTGTLSATAFAPVSWYATSTPTNPIATGNTFTSNAVTTTTYYAQAVNTTTSNLFVSLAGGNGQSGNMFDIVAQSNIEVNGFDMHISNTSTNSIEIWYRPGTWVGFNTSSAGWLQAGTATVTGMGTGSLTPVPLTFTVPMQAGQTYGFYVTVVAGGNVAYTNGTAIGNVWASNSDLQVLEGNGGTYFNVTFSPRCFNGQVRYTKPGCTSPVIPVVLTVSAPPTVTASASAGTVCPGVPVTLTAGGANTYSWSTGATTFSTTDTPTISTTYSVIGTNTAGCSDTATVFVNSGGSLTVTASAVNSTVCAGGSTALNANGASTYTWSTGANGSIIAVTPSVTTTYSVTGDNGLGCTGTGTVNVMVNPLPTVSIVASQTVACINGPTIGLTGSPAGGVYTGSNVSGSVFTPGANSGTFNPGYNVTSTLTGCSNTSYATIIVSSCTGLNKLAGKTNGVMVYPNPNTGIFTVELNNGANKNIELCDLTGRVILNEKTSQDKMEINISNLANGVYFIKVQSDGVVEIIKVIKQ